MIECVYVWKPTKPSTKNCFPRRTPNAICCPSARLYEFPNKSELEAQHRNSFSSLPASPTFSCLTAYTMAPISARTAVDFPFHRRIGDSYQYWNPLSCALQSLDTASPSVPATSKSKKEYTHQYAFRQLVNSIGKLVWIAKLDASKADIEDRFLPKELILKVFPDTIVPNPLPESSHKEEPLSQLSLTPVPDPAAIFASSADKSTIKKKSSQKSGTASSKATKTSSDSPLGKKAGIERVHTPYETLWQFTEQDYHLSSQPSLEGCGDRLYDFMDKHSW